MIPKPTIIDYYTFSHGYYQSSLYGNNTILFLIGLDNKQVQNIKEMYKLEKFKISIECFNFNHIIEYEILFNQWLIELIKTNQISQNNWLGKDTQSIIYSEK